MELTERHDLRNGDTAWLDADPDFLADPAPDRADVAIVGAGVMGAMVAERLASEGARVALVDRRPPGHGSTAASTALVMWEMDTPLTHLAERIGRDEAMRRWQRVHQAVVRLKQRIDGEGLDGRATARPVVYLEGALLPGEDLEREGAMRDAAGLPSRWLGAGSVAERFGIAPCAALVSDDGFTVDPVRLTLALLARARACGATASWPCDAAAIETVDRGIVVSGDGFRILADRVILAPGYERARMFLPPAFSLLSSYAIASAPGTAPLWGENAMIWQAADPYLYTRADAEGRIIAGGEDEDFSDALRRDALLPGKSGTIAGKLAAMTDSAPIGVERRWAATFGASPDGLPAIGPARNHERVWLASGFGGNGVSFASLAAEIIAGKFAGRPDPVAGGFDPYRFA